MESELVRLLRDLIRFDTSNPPGNERPAVDYIADLLRREGIEWTVIEPRPGRASLVARIKGGPEPPLLLSAHLDVVPALEGWEHPPFAAEIHEGYVWGRGAVDMKQMAAMCLKVLLEIKRGGLGLRRDLVFAAVADEEAGGLLGAGYLVDHHPELIRAGHCLTELGGMTVSMELPWDISARPHFLPKENAIERVVTSNIPVHYDPLLMLSLSAGFLLIFFVISIVLFGKLRNIKPYDIQGG